MNREQPKGYVDMPPDTPVALAGRAAKRQQLSEQDPVYAQLPRNRREERALVAVLRRRERAAKKKAKAA